MWKRTCPFAIAAILAGIFLLLPQLIADDGDDSDGSRQDDGQFPSEFAAKVEQFNRLLKQERCNEAILLGKQARLLEPENPVAEIMVLKAKLLQQDAINRLSRKFKATLVADLRAEPDRSSAIHETLRAAEQAIDGLKSGGDESAAHGRCLLNASLERRIGLVDQICSLTDTQKRKLRLSGNGDIQRFLDRVEDLRPNYNDEPLDDFVCGTFCFGNPEPIRPSRSLGLFEHGSLFAKVLKRSLSETQAAALEASRCRSLQSDE